MKSFDRLLRRALVIAMMSSVGATVATAARPAADTPGPRQGARVAYAFDDPRPHPIESLTLRDIAASNAEVEMAYRALMQMWTGHFDAIGAAFEVPTLLRYRGTVRTSCGVMPAGNAAYCPARNAIYFDEVFIASMAKRIGAELGTDGDMAAVGVIAHEVGHAVAIQLGYASRFTYDNEAAADCLAGAFARQSAHDGSLEKGDLEEAFLGMALAGDPDLVVETGASATMSRRTRGARMSHGTRDQRMQNFRAGFEKGPGGCLPHFDE